MKAHRTVRSFADGCSHDAGTWRRTDPITVFDTPSLRFVGLSAPYGHQGQYETLGDLLAATDHQMMPRSPLTPDERSALEGYLLSL